MASLTVEFSGVLELGDGFSLETAKIVYKAVPRIKVVALTEKHFEKSLERRAKHGLGIFDSTHAAVCLSQDGRMASTDGAFDRVPGLQRVK